MNTTEEETAALLLANLVRPHLDDNDADFLDQVLNDHEWDLAAAMARNAAVSFGLNCGQTLVATGASQPEDLTGATTHSQTALPSDVLLDRLRHRHNSGEGCTP
ncbi:hypothetical protein NQ036_10385 [Brevibacterium sp. 91QC2O2]|uniref:hypothetical protein n=1 Tax=Brevibacterium sp. 91QC2O2 TaxID=2968458 RepID=UPI00211BBF53|nr:hypothetical protein [Brevibacterium sp. 91QC2O2]MCQ9368643.1 hypothetical protein [Brevibacterium sp. 91QC2O2]